MLMRLELSKPWPYVALTEAAWLHEQRENKQKRQYNEKQTTVMCVGTLLDSTHTLITHEHQQLTTSACVIDMQEMWCDAEKR
jgi:hypothetical protein